MPSLETHRIGRMLAPLAGRPSWPELCNPDPAMAQLIRTLVNPVYTSDGGRFKAAVYGRRRGDGMWEGWLEFIPASGLQPALETESETVQNSEAQLDYW